MLTRAGVSTACTAGILSALSGLLEGAGLKYWCMITLVALSEGKRAISICQLPHNVIVALEDKVLSVLTQMECVCFWNADLFVPCRQGSLN